MGLALSHYKVKERGYEKESKGVGDIGGWLAKRTQWDIRHERGCGETILEGAK